MLNKVVTLTEAAEKVGVVEGTLRASIKRGDFKEDIDYRKAGRITLIVLESVEKKYNKIK